MDPYPRAGSPVGSELFERYDTYTYLAAAIPTYNMLSPSNRESCFNAVVGR